MNRFLVLFFFLAVLPLRAARPVIAHEAPERVPAGQPLRLLARVSSAEPLRRVTLHLTQSGTTAPISLPMRQAGTGIYTVTLDPPLFSGGGSFRYYLDAHTNSGEFAETNWFTVQVVGGGEAGGGEETPWRWRKPVLIGAGAAAAVGVGIAASNRGGSSGGGDPDPGGDPADQLAVRTLGDSARADTVNLPVERSVDIAGDLAGRRIRRVRIRLDFDPVDEGPETYAVVYNGREVIRQTAQNAPRTDQVDVVGAADSTVTVRVLNSVPGAEGHAWQWNATVTYFLGD